jgi:two-component system cell cycle sensor histidine kinase/response regulator CckA
VGQHGTEGHRETILVVEDAEPIRRMVTAMLMQSGYDCLEAPDGTEALALLDTRAEPVHLVLTDLLMPKMTGAELAEHLSRLRPGLPIVFMSGYTEDPVVVTVGQTRGNFLAKPFTAGALLEKVRQALVPASDAP